MDKCVIGGVHESNHVYSWIQDIVMAVFLAI